MKVLFVSAFRNENDPSRIYRCDNAATQIRRSGGKATVIDQFILKDRHDLIRFSDIVIFQRVTHSPDLEAALRVARQAGVAVAVEYDDLIFSPWDIKYQGAVRSGVITDVEAQTREAFLRLQYLPWVDAAIASTPAIAEVFDSFGIPAFIAKNAIDDEVEEKCVKTKVGRMGKLLYMSGTKTHGADFEIIHKPLARFMKDHPKVELTLLGALDAPKELTDLSNVSVVGKLPMPELLPFVSKFDLSLVPLEDTIFNHCKSSLKYFESGFVSVPVLASPRREFASDITDGVNGLLAETPDDWYRALQACHGQASLMQQITGNAHERVLREYTIGRRGDTYVDMLNQIVRLRTRSAKRAKQFELSTIAH